MTRYQRTTLANSGQSSSAASAAIRPVPQVIRPPRVLSDTEEVTGSNPVAPTIKALTSGNVVGFLLELRGWAAGGVPDESTLQLTPRLDGRSAMG